MAPYKEREPRMSADLAFLSVNEASTKLVQGEVSSLELTHAALAQADRLEPHTTPLVHRLDERALSEAEASDERRRQNAPLGPLDGLPFTLKDIIDVAGVPTGAGSKVFDGNVPNRSATSASLLEEAGSVLIGKARTHEFAWGGLTLPARNAWDADRIPGGSSGGSASGVASGIGIFTLGTDTAGSVRSPATFNGTVGLKPTYGKIGRSGVVPLAWSLDTVGVLARSVADTALVYDTIAGPDPLDHTSIQTPHEAIAGNVGQDIAGLRIGVPDAYFFQTIQEEVARQTQKGLDALEEAGATLTSITLTPAETIESALTSVFIIIGAESAAYHGDWIDSKRDLYGEDVLHYLDMGRALSATSYVDAQRARHLTTAAFNRAFEDVDVIVTPGQGHIAPRVDEEMVNYSNGESIHRDPAGIRNLAVINLTGLPGLIVPTGLADGLPTGIQLVGPPLSQGLLLRAGRTVEDRVGYLGKRPPLAGS